MKPRGEIMPRKKAKTAEGNLAEVTPRESTATATLDPPPAPEANAVTTDSPTTETQVATQQKPFANPYRPVYSSKSAGFEMGENYRFKQRVFSFDERPADHVIVTLKENGFTYRPAEKSWTIPANAETRVLTDRLAREFAGQEVSASR
jgi:hypothetical protein